MSLIGLQTYIFLKFNFFFNKKKFFLSAIILGLLLPEIDSIFLSIYYIITGSKIDTSIFDKNFTHSFITLSIIYLMFLIFYEIKKETYIVNFARSVMIGMTSNIILDIFLRIGNINIFWPLPIAIINKVNYSILFIHHIFILEFLFIRLASYELINKNLNNPIDSSPICVKHYSILMKIQFIFIILFSILVVFMKFIVLETIIGLYALSLVYFIWILFKNRKIF